MAMFKVIAGKRYTFFASRDGRTAALKTAQELRDKGLNARALKDRRRFASTWHVYTRKK